MKYITVVIAALLALSACTAKDTVSQKDQKIGQAVKKEGEAFLLEGGYTDALKKFLESVKLIPKDPYLHHDLGLAYMGKNRYQLAETHFQKAIELNPDYMAALNSLGTAYLKQGKYDKAIEQFQKVSDNILYATPHYPLSNIGWAYYRKNDFLQAKNYFKKALKDNPDFVQAIHGQSLTYLSLQMPEKAVSLLEEKIQKVPSVAVLHSDLAKAYEAVYEYDKAKRSWEQVLNLAEENSSLFDEAEKQLRLLE